MYMTLISQVGFIKRRGMLLCQLENLLLCSLLQVTDCTRFYTKTKFLVYDLNFSGWLYKKARYVTMPARKFIIQFTLRPNLAKP